MIPSFSFQGGKARLRNWLINYFPKTGKTYFEPFVGKGNVFFASKLKLNFEFYSINDIDIKFFEALISCNLEDLPQDVNTKEKFFYWRDKKDFISKVIEPRITFCGKGYKYGFNSNTSGHVGYAYKNYHEICSCAKESLLDVTLSELNWEDINWEIYDENDFVYLDPPYYGTKSCYPNIDHEKLVKFLNTSKFRWALSGYDNEIYKNLNFVSRYEKIRNSEIKGRNKREFSPVIEVLWTSYLI